MCNAIDLILIDFHTCRRGDESEEEVDIPIVLQQNEAYCSSALQMQQNVYCSTTSKQKADFEWVCRIEINIIMLISIWIHSFNSIQYSYVDDAASQHSANQMQMVKNAAYDSSAQLLHL